MGRKTAVDDLPIDVRRWLEKALADRNYTGYLELETLLREQGYVIGRSSIHRFGQKIERRQAAIRASTEAARLLIEGAPDDQDARSEALIALVQSELFDSIVNITEAGDEELTRAERIDLLSSAAKNIATMARASVHQKRHRLELEIEAAARKKLVEDQKERLGELQKSGELPDDMAAKVIQVIMDTYGLQA